MKKQKMESRAVVERRVIRVNTEEPEAGQIALEAREEGAEEGLPKITGYTAVFGVDTEIDTWFGPFKERIQKGAFKRAIREGQNVRALRNHDPDNLLGSTASKTLRLREDETGLHIEVETPNTELGRETVELIRRGDLSGMSFAFIIRKEKWVNGEDGAPDLRIIQDVDLYDVGPVTYPAYDQTSTDLRSASLAYRVGFAECGKPVPPLPPEARAEAETVEEEVETAPVEPQPDRTAFRQRVQEAYADEFLALEKLLTK